MPTLALGLRVGHRRGGLPATYGANMIPAGAWTASGTGATADATAVHFSASPSLATAYIAVTTENDTTYQITYTISNFVSGGVRGFVSGNTSAHGGSGTSRTANGTYVEEVTTSGAGANANRFAFLTTLSNTTLDISIDSVQLKKKLT